MAALGDLELVGLAVEEDMVEVELDMLLMDDVVDEDEVEDEIEEEDEEVEEDESVLIELMENVRRVPSVAAASVDRCDEVDVVEAVPDDEVGEVDAELLLLPLLLLLLWARTRVSATRQSRRVKVLVGHTRRILRSEWAGVTVGGIRK